MARSRGTQGSFLFRTPFSLKEAVRTKVTMAPGALRCPVIVTGLHQKPSKALPNDLRAWRKGSEELLTKL
ncbi:hypothetical protein NHX12_031147 [Muraenolepis orangiensis]|uniref:Uncharacterized protein n=1 Tax=Muraenolepis orangiensis TaxID=630683 RepID=A0A9Q0EA21_9TELE|nr:hypothetical protein NHX12_031147 [Muraenolepis orangiensis]